MDNLTTGSKYFWNYIYAGTKREILRRGDNEAIYSVISISIF